MYKESKGFHRLKERYVIVRDGHKGKVRGDLIHFRNGPNGHKLSFVIIHLLFSFVYPLSDVSNTIFQTTGASWEV